jgi:hypothetical protein
MITENVIIFVHSRKTHMKALRSLEVAAQVKRKSYPTSTAQPSAAGSHPCTKPQNLFDSGILVKYCTALESSPHVMLRMAEVEV